MHAMNQNKKRYAVAVRDGQDLLLVLDICRAPDGDVYVDIPRN